MNRGWIPKRAER